MKKLLVLLLAGVLPILLKPEPTTWQKTKDVLTSKPVIFVYGAVLGGGAVKLFFCKALQAIDKKVDQIIADVKAPDKVELNDTVLEQVRTVIKEEVQLVISNKEQKNMPTLGEKIYKVVCSRKGGFIEYLKDIATRSNVIYFKEEYGRWKLTRSFQVAPLFQWKVQETKEFNDKCLKVLEEIKSNLIAYNEYLISIGEPEYDFIYFFDEEYKGEFVGIGGRIS